jgi:hypothetical protein
MIADVVRDKDSVVVVVLASPISASVAVVRRLPGGSRKVLFRIYCVMGVKENISKRMHRKKGEKQII